MTKSKLKAIEGQDQMKVNIRRQWNDWRIAEAFEILLGIVILEVLQLIFVIPLYMVPFFT